MGPTCEVALPADITDETLDAIDRYLRRSTEVVNETRKGNRWEIRVEGRPISITVDARQISFAAGCNSPIDHSVLKSISNELAKLLCGKASDPVK